MQEYTLEPTHTPWWQLLASTHLFTLTPGTLGRRALELTGISGWLNHYSNDPSKPFPAQLRAPQASALPRCGGTTDAGQRFLLASALSPSQVRIPEVLLTSAWTWAGLASSLPAKGDPVLWMLETRGSASSGIGKFWSPGEHSTGKLFSGVPESAGIASRRMEKKMLIKKECWGWVGHSLRCEFLPLECMGVGEEGR